MLCIALCKYAVESRVYALVDCRVVVLLWCYVMMCHDACVVYVMTLLVCCVAVCCRVVVIL